MHIVIATTNYDKFSAVFTQLQTFGFTNARFSSLRDIGFTKEIVESGSSRDRSHLKVSETVEFLKQDTAIPFDVVVGVDDSFYVPKIKKQYLETHEVAAAIIEGDVLQPNDEFVIHHDFTFYLDLIPKYFFVKTTDFFTYIGNKDTLKIEKQTNPLKYVLAFKGDTRPIYTLSDQEVNEYILSFSKVELQPFIENIKSHL